MAKKEFPRNGAWAVDGMGRCGIIFLARFDDGTTREEFHIVNEVGETKITQIRPWVLSDEMKASEGALLRSRLKDGSRLEEYVLREFLSPDDADLPIEPCPWTALSIAPVSAIPSNRIVGLSAEDLANMGYLPEPIAP